MPLITKRCLPPRRGSVLLVVLVVIALLALGAYSFSELMVSESHATGVFGREAQARACADSGIELAAAVLGRPSDDGSFENVLHDPQHYGGVTLKESNNARGRARFSLIAPNESDPSNTTLRFGFIDESSKLNLNALVAQEKQQQSRSSTATGTSTSTGSSSTTGGSSTGSNSSNSGSSQTSGSSGSGGSSATSGSSSSDTSSTTSTADPASRLLLIPGMTNDLADAILDFIDEDETSRTYGCESAYYSSLQPAYAAKNSPLESIDELLLVRGVTAQLLYGEDFNRNGMLDPNENDGDASWPTDDADGVLQLGWSAYLTVFGREKNTRWDGSTRININNNNLAELYDQLEQEFDATVAQFVVAYRVTSQAQSTATNAAGSGGAIGGQSTGGGQPSGGGNATTANLNQQYSQLQQAATALGSAIGGGSGTVTRGGIDLSKGSGKQLVSIYELVGATAQATVNGSAQTLQSPWAADGNSMTSYLPSVLDTLTLNSDQFTDGRISINQARYETLLTVPGMTESVAEMILTKRQGSDGGPLVDTSGARATAGWLVIESLVDLPTMQQLDKYVTARGGIYRVNSVGYFDEAGPFTRLEAVIDTTQSKKPPVVLFLKDLTDLGRGYPQQVLLGTP
ncbi:MAG: type II secretory pathway component PulK-like protein [Planctomycetota bacterium]|nr:MAG: type II secretory pathway component PulK-like protein [Planctomycetota bacterium]